MKIIPAIDIIKGKTVRLTQGDYDQKKEYDQTPLQLAQYYSDLGFTHLHLVDLDGAKQSQPANLPILQSITEQTALQVDFGGGVKSEASLRQVFHHGANQVNIGSLAIKDSDLVKSWIKTYGSHKIIVGADVKDNKIAIHGWQETSTMGIMDFVADYVDSGAQYFVCTDVSKDGMMQGSSLDLYRELISAFPDISLIASGGVSTMEELQELQSIGVYGAIIGKAFFEGLLSPKTVAQEYSLC